MSVWTARRVAVPSGAAAFVGPVAFGALIAALLAWVLTTFQTGTILLLYGGVALLLPMAVLGEVRLYWLAVFLLALPFNIKKLLSDRTAAADFVARYGTPPAAIPSVVVFVTDLALLVLLALWAWRILERNLPVILPAVFWLGAAFVAWCGLTVLMAPVKMIAVLEVINRVKYLLVFLYIANTISSRREVRLIFICLGLGVAIQGVISLINFGLQSIESPFGNLFGSTTYLEDLTRLNPHFSVKGGASRTLYRVAGTFNHPNSQGQYYAMLLPFVWCLIMAGRTIWARLGWTTVFLLGMAGLVVTFSRGAMAGLLGGLIVTVFLGSYRGLLPRSALRIGVAIFLIASPLAYMYMLTRPKYFTFRPQLWDVGLPIVYDHPILGVGVNNATVVGYTYPDPWGVFWGTHFHNFYLTTAVEIGLVGLGLLLLMFFCASRSALRSFPFKAEERFLNWLSVAIPASFAALALHLSVDHLLGETITTILWMNAALGAVVLPRLKSLETA